MRYRTSAVVLTALALSATLAACSGAPQPETTATATSKPAASDTPAPSTSPEPVETEHVDEPAADPTCETIIAPSTIEIFEEHNWTHEQHDFRIGADVIEGGLQCIWGDYTVASDHVQVFGWAPISAAESSAEQQKLLADGWIRADEGGRTYITEDPEFSMSVDEAGYGMTYEFGDGWVTVADTKQGLVLIQHP